MYVLYSGAAALRCPGVSPASAPERDDAAAVATSLESLYPVLLFILISKNQNKQMHGRRQQTY